MKISDMYNFSPPVKKEKISKTKSFKPAESLSAGFSSLAFDIARGNKGVRIQLPNGKWYTSYNTATRKAKVVDLLLVAKRLDKTKLEIVQ